MLERVAALVGDLRSAGVPVSTSELLDSLVALRAAGLEHRSTVKAALQATLVKRPEHVNLFEAVFAAHFAPDPIAISPGLVSTDLSDLLQSLPELDSAGLAAAARHAVVQFGGLTEGRSLGVDYHVRRVMRNLLGDDAVSIAESIDLQARLDAFEIEMHKQRLVDEVTAEVRRRTSADKGTQWAWREARDKAPENLDFLRLTSTEALHLRRTVRALSRKLAARLRARRRHSHSGRLHMAATVRRSLASGGVPFEPVFRRARPQSPEVVVLADVSGSVASFARFTLQLVHALSGQFSQLRTFAFVDEVDEVTRWFSHGNDFESAMAKVNGRARTQGEVGHSDYGSVLTMFSERWGSELRPTSTVIVLGDARNNYHSVRAPALEGIAKKVRKLYWFNPEPRSYWNTADSVIAAYEPYCDAVFECRNLEQLATAVEKVS